MTFSEFCKSRGVDEAKLSASERAFAMKMFGLESAPEPEQPRTAKCGCGGTVCVGETVTLTLKVTGIHHYTGSPAHGIPDREVLNLAMTLDGKEVHVGTYNALHVRKDGKEAKK